MADMKFKFTIQPYQTEAVDSVVGVFAGQPFNDRFQRDSLFQPRSVATPQTGRLPSTKERSNTFTLLLKPKAQWKR